MVSTLILVVMTVVQGTFGFRWGTAKRLKQMAGTVQGEEGQSSEPIFRKVGMHFFTPSGGIPARSGGSTGPWTPGSADCVRCEYYMDGSTDKIRQTSPAISVKVFNASKNSIGGSLLIQAKLIDGRWTIDVDDCE